MDFELLKWGDHTIRLSHWDSLHGVDKIYILNKDGTVDVEWADSEDEKVYRHPVNLVQELRELALAAAGEGTQ